jgi:hypothetical protein
VAHPGHLILQARAAGREVVRGRPEIMKVQARCAIAWMACGQETILLKVAAA